LHNRQRMRISNQKVVEKLILDGYDDIWLKPHTARNDTVYTQERKYLATDLWNLFDGICYFNGRPIFLQIKTNSWAPEKPIKQFLKTHYIHVIVFNVTNKLKSCNGKYKIFSREYK